MLKLVSFRKNLPQFPAALGSRASRLNTPLTHARRRGRAKPYMHARHRVILNYNTTLFGCIIAAIRPPTTTKHEPTIPRKCQMSNRHLPGGPLIGFFPNMEREQDTHFFFDSEPSDIKLKLHSQLRPLLNYLDPC